MQSVGTLIRRPTLISPTDYWHAYDLTIHDDITYTSKSVLYESNANTIDSWGETILELDTNIVARIECAAFSGEYLSSVAYYDDFYTMCEKYGYNWFSNDFNFTSYAYVSWEDALNLYFPGSTNLKYEDGWIRKELFDMYQKHLPVIIID